MFLFNSLVGKTNFARNSANCLKIFCYQPGYHLGARDSIKVSVSNTLYTSLDTNRNYINRKNHEKSLKRSVLLYRNGSKHDSAHGSKSEDGDNSFKYWAIKFSDWFTLAVAAYGVFWFFDYNLVSFSVIIGSSMLPTLNPEGSKFKDVVLVSREATHDYDLIKRGQIVLFYSTRDPMQLNIKRVIGLEGDKIQPVGHYRAMVTVPPGHMWVEGDNTRSSYDSNRVGPIPLGLVRGTATRIIWPPSRWQILERKLPLNRIMFNSNTDPKDAELPLLNEHLLKPVGLHL